MNANVLLHSPWSVLEPPALCRVHELDSCHAVVGPAGRNPPPPLRNKDELSWAQCHSA